MKIIHILILLIVITLLSSNSTFSQTDSGTMPRIIEKDGRHALLVDGKPVFYVGRSSA